MNSSTKKVKKIRNLYSDWEKKKLKKKIGRRFRNKKILKCDNCGSKKSLRKVKNNKYLCGDCYDNR